MTHAQPRSLGQWLSRITAAGRTIDVTRTHRPTDRIAMTARVSVADGRLRIHRTGVARWLGGSVDVPLAHVRSVDIADQQDVKLWNKGVRLVGIQIPGLMTSGIFRHDGRLTWWDVGRDSRAIAIEFRDERLTRAVIEVDDPAAVLRTLDQAL
jgi:hypothetical protein